jgi:hypothetical protein
MVYSIRPSESSKNGLQQFEKRFGFISALQELCGFVSEFGAQGKSEKFRNKVKELRS